MKQSHSALFISVFLVLFCTVFLFHCNDGSATASTNLADSSFSVYGPYRIIPLSITKGVVIQNPIQIALGNAGKLYATNQAGAVYVLHDSDGDHLEDSAALFCDISSMGLKSPAGLAFRNDTVFIGATEGVYCFLDRDKDGKSDSSWVFFNDIPHSAHPYEWTSGICFGPDGFLYAAITTDSWNAGASPDPKGYRGAIIRISPDGKRAERMATGIRSVYGMAFHPSGELLFVDNEGGGNPHEELNRLIPGKFYGHNGKKYTGHDSTTLPEWELRSEVAPSGIEFNKAGNDFGNAGGALFVAYYGPGERWSRGAVGKVTIGKGADGQFTYEESLVADIPKLSDLAFGADGSLYVAHHGLSDYWYNPTQQKTGGFYKIVFDATVKDFRKQAGPRMVKAEASSIAEGKSLFARSACAACHSVVDSVEFLGPNLNGLGKRMSREEILDDIQYPGKRIKPGMVGTRIELKNGQVLLGRIVQATESSVDIMLVGNKIETVKRTDILQMKNHDKSLMYENLLKSLKPEEINYLLDYLQSL